MPLPGIYASQISGHLFQPAGSYDALATTTLSTNTTPIVFSGIPAGYKHLQIRMLSRTTRNDASVDGFYIRFNGDTASNYSSHLLSGQGSSATANGYANTTVIYGTFWGADAQTTANVYTASIVDILDYGNINTYKTARTFSGYDANGTGSISLTSGNWRNQAAITSITLLAEGSFVANSSFALYGVK